LQANAWSFASTSKKRIQVKELDSHMFYATRFYKYGFAKLDACGLQLVALFAINYNSAQL